MTKDARTAHAGSPVADRRPAVLFDMDGTLLDSIDLILDGAAFAFEGRAVAPTRAEWRALIGTPLDSMLGHWATTPDDVQFLRGRYRQFQLEHHDEYVRLYDGVEDTLRGLHTRGHRLGIVSSKLDAGIRRSMDYFGLTPLFEVIVGMDHTANHKPHPEPVRFALSRLGLEPRDAIFVGDSPHDIESGNAATVPTVGVTWGAFTRVEIERARPTHWIEQMTDLTELVARIE